MFQVGDKIVHPMHGAGVIDSIVTKKVNGVVRDYYILKLPVGGMLVMIPTSNSEEIGVRLWWTRMRRIGSLPPCLTSRWT